MAQNRATTWRKSAWTHGAGGLLGVREHVTDLVHLPGFGAVSGANEGATKGAKERQTISNSQFYKYSMQKNSISFKKIEEKRVTTFRLD